ncbi:MAG: Hpt domain-containing protein, partial [Mesorhizobium sp.]|nr:Hpt domain-containing protein [Mesorhizobium sp.]
MALPNVLSVPFAVPGGEVCRPSTGRPIDLAHLSHQTLGDRGIEQEVLALFVQQATMVRDRIVHATPAERATLAHGLRGSAGGVGAFALADCAKAIEHNPHDKPLVLRLAARIDEVKDF